MDVEFAVGELHLLHLQYRFFETGADLGLYITQFTKTLTELPQKFVFVSLIKLDFRICYYIFSFIDWRNINEWNAQTGMQQVTRERAYALMLLAMDLLIFGNNKSVSSRMLLWMLLKLLCQIMVHHLH